MGHQICIEDFDEYVVSVQLAASHGKGDNKTLHLIYELKGTPIYTVSNGSEDFRYYTLEDAVEKYNRL